MYENDLRGAFQAIGFKQFIPALKSFNGCNYDEIEATIKERCFDDFVLSTIRYTKKQNRWVKNRILTDKNIKSLTIDVTETELTKYQELCCAALLEKCSNAVLSYPSITPTTVSSERLTRFSCNVCEKVTIGSSSWQAHCRSKKHRRLSTKQKKS
ncbi:hypothetical protein MXB_955 [Myxobolus squamalis]|nr:hypothetical protein MXB_955 [Myxobolus squamalis]